MRDWYDILNDYADLDLTPSYLYNEDAIHFHKTLKETCDRHDKRYYPDFKKWCDKYFYVEHRKETRGIGGIFFDDLDGKDQNELFSFVNDACSSFIPCYLPIIQRRKVLTSTITLTSGYAIYRTREELATNSTGTIRRIQSCPRSWNTIRSAYSRRPNRIDINVFTSDSKMGIHAFGGTR